LVFFFFISMMLFIADRFMTRIEKMMPDIAPRSQNTSEFMATAKTSYWTELYSKWEQFTQNPTDDILLEIYNMLPDTKDYASNYESDAWKNAERKAKTALYDELSALEKKIEQGSEAGIKVGVRLFVFADGALAEELILALGASLNNYPEVSLREIYAHRNTLCSTDDVLLSAGVYEEDKEDKILKERYLIIQSITDPSLKDIKQKALETLKNYAPPEG
ncbi:MAG: hypothetical protein NTW04_01320, partial [Elusimicrobia bacterium]|nr:hypothetical protein [Elusimicrobiota bacterium]